MNFIDKIRFIDINVPVSAGIMPLVSYSQINTIAKLSSAVFPDELKILIEKYKDNPSDFQKAGIEFSSNQINSLLISGYADGIHIYTMNRPDISFEVFSTIVI